MYHSNSFCIQFPENLRQLLDNFVRRRVCTGASIAVGRFGELSSHCVSGWADVEKQKPIDSDTLFQMYSLTKPVTAVAVMQLWEKGYFQLQDPIETYLPAYRHMQVCHTRADGSQYLLPASRSITIHDLLTMTAGITYGEPGLIGAGLKKLSEGMIKSRKSGSPWDTLKYVDELAKVPLAFDPGSHYQYGLCFDVLGALVEVCSKKRLDHYCQEHIFSPLGMTSATFLITEASKHKLALSYALDAEGNRIPEQRVTNDAINAYTLENTSFISGGSGLICTLDDYFKFAKMLANKGETEDGQILLQESTLRLLSAPQLSASQLEDFPEPGDTCLFSSGYSYGYGIHVMTDPKNHLPKGEWGWAGTMGTWMSIDPVNEVFWVYAHQVVPPNYEDYIPELIRLIYSSLR